MRVFVSLVMCWGFRAPKTVHPRKAVHPPLWSSLPIDVGAGGPVQYLHRGPDVVLVEQVLTPDECKEIVSRATLDGLDRSPVAYAGWTADVADATKLWASGPATWLGLATVLVAHNAYAIDDRAMLAGLAISVWLASSLCALGAAALWTRKVESSLLDLRTSTSVALQSGPSPAEVKIFDRLARLLGVSPTRFEALTVIRYEPGQALAKHFDANRAAADEDADRGGQTLATLLVYLNDIQTGGQTRFNRLGPLDVQPKVGDACLFFPADRFGVFDDRLEHEGLPVDGDRDKWIARVWVHENDVRPPCGLQPPTVDAVRSSIMAA